MPRENKNSPNELNERNSSPTKDIPVRRRRSSAPHQTLPSRSYYTAQSHYRPPPSLTVLTPQEDEFHTPTYSDIHTPIGKGGRHRSADSSTTSTPTVGYRQPPNSGTASQFQQEPSPFFTHSNMMNNTNNSGSTPGRRLHLNSVPKNVIRMQTKSWSHRELEMFSKKTKPSSANIPHWPLMPIPSTATTMKSGIVNSTAISGPIDKITTTEHLFRPTATTSTASAELKNTTIEKEQREEEDPFDFKNPYNRLSNSMPRTVSQLSLLKIHRYTSQRTSIQGRTNDGQSSIRNTTHNKSSDVNHKKTSTSLDNRHVRVIVHSDTDDVNGNGNIIHDDDGDERRPLLVNQHHHQSSPNRNQPLNQHSEPFQFYPPLSVNRKLNFKNQGTNLSSNNNNDISSDNSAIGISPCFSGYQSRSPYYYQQERSRNSFLEHPWSHLSLIKHIPAVLLGVVLNLLDAMSYGIIIFPASGSYIPETATQAGISMFLASTVIAQLTYSLGGSQFSGAVGSMMIEVMPFLHIMCNIVKESMIGQPDENILATIMLTYAMSSIMTGIVFLLLGKYKLGNVIQFFPRHILVGCIGGIGLFLLITGMEVTSRIKPELSKEVLLQLLEFSKMKLWLSSLCLAFLLKLLQRSIHHPLFVPSFYVSVPIIFYIVSFVWGYNVEQLREYGWLFDLPAGKEAPFYTFWTYYNMFKVDWLAVIDCIPTMFALTFFGILHVPINVPALAVSTHQDVDTNKELMGHGISNLASGFFGTCQNYLVYSNSVLYFRSGGTTKSSGLLLAATTALAWFYGSAIAGLIPVLVVGGLIFHLGIDLIKESVIDTYNVGMLPLEYLTVIFIVFVMGFFGFTEGILTGIVLACVFFVVMYSRKSVIRTSFTGKDVKSTVHRLYRQKQFLNSVGDQIHVLQLQGFMFFGTVHQLDEHINQLLHDTVRVRYVIIDFKLINGVDYSATEAFNRLKKMMAANHCHLILCSVSESMQHMLEKSGIFDEEDVEDEEVYSCSDDDDEHLSKDYYINTAPSESATTTGRHFDNRVLVFDTLSSALEFCENKLLSVFYRHRHQRQGASMVMPNVINPEVPEETVIMSPRREVLERAAVDTLDRLTVDTKPEILSNFLLEVFMEMSFTGTGYLNLQETMELHAFCDWFIPQFYLEGSIVWDEGDESNEMYILENGEMELLSRSQNEYQVKETYLCGSMIGQLNFFAHQPHQDRLICKEEVSLWKLDRASFNKLKKEQPHLVLKYIPMALRSASSISGHTNSVVHM